MNIKTAFFIPLFTLICHNNLPQENEQLWMKHELSFKSDKKYSNPLYDVKDFNAIFTAASGRSIKLNRFWDGGNQFKIRFAPDETGTWSYEIFCSEEKNSGLYSKTGTFNCMPGNSSLEIGRRVFSDDPPGLAAQQPHGRLWIGDNHAEEDWLDIVGYQSSHSKRQETVDWITKGEIATRWDNIRAKPVINLEPNYEEINNTIDDEDVRNASNRSIFATPVAGISYGANGIWPWIRDGEKTFNHRQPEHVSTWRQNIDLPGSIQIGYLAGFMNNLSWWQLRPANEMLANQPGVQAYKHFISVSKSVDNEFVIAYIPHPSTITLYSNPNLEYTGQWFNPRINKYSDASITKTLGTIQATSPDDGDYLQLLKTKFKSLN